MWAGGRGPSRSFTEWRVCGKVDEGPSRSFEKRRVAAGRVGSIKALTLVGRAEDAVASETETLRSFGEQRACVGRRNPSCSFGERRVRQLVRMGNEDPCARLQSRG